MCTLYIYPEPSILDSYRNEAWLGPNLCRGTSAEASMVFLRSPGRGTVRCLAWSPSGQLLASACSWNPGFSIWDVAQGVSIPLAAGASARRIRCFLSCCCCKWGRGVENLALPSLIDTIMHRCVMICLQNLRESYRGAVSVATAGYAQASFPAPVSGALNGRPLRKICTSQNTSLRSKCATDFEVPSTNFQPRDSSGYRLGFQGLNVLR